MPSIIHWFLRFSFLNPICIRLIGAASRRQRDLYIRGVYLPGFELMGTMMITTLAAAAIAGRFRDDDDDSEESRELDARLF